MNVKFFGNSLDLFKYDVLFNVISDEELLYYVPMLTAPKERVVDPKYLIYEVGSLNEKLKDKMVSFFKTDSDQFDKILDCFDEARVDYKIVLHSSNDSDKIVRLEDLQEFFNNDEREKYFHYIMQSCNQIERDKIIFLDPDIGLNLTVKRRFRSMKDGYLKTEELKHCFFNSGKNDVVCFFQHLGNHRYSVTDRLKDLKVELGEYVLIVGYKKIQGSLIFAFKNKRQYVSYQNKLKEYLKRYENYKKKDNLILQ